MGTRSKRLRAAAIGLVGVVAVYGLVGGLVAPPLAKRLLAAKLEERLGRVVALDDLTFNPYTLEASLKGLRILEADRKTAFVSFDALEVDGSAASIYRLAPVIDELTLAGLKVRLVRETETTYSVDDIVRRLAPKQSAAGARGKDEGPARFAVQNIRVVDAVVEFDDRPARALHRVSEVRIAIPFISNLPTHLKDLVQPSFSANVNGTPVRLTGQALPFENTVRTNFNLDIRALEIPRYLAYLPAGLPATVQSGKLDARIALRFTQAAGKEPAVDIAGTTSLEGVSLATRDGPLGRFDRLEADLSSLDPLGGVLKVASLRLAGAAAMQDEWKISSIEVRDIDVALAKNTVRVASLSTSGGQLALKRQGDGTIELPRMVTAAGGGEPPAKWDVAVGKLALAEYAMTLHDGAVQPAVVHRAVVSSLEAEDLSTDNGFKGKATAKVRIGKSGLLDASSTFAIEPLEVNLALDARSIDLVPLRAYVPQFSTVALKGGTASGKGTLTLRGEGDAIRVAYTGSGEVVNFATLDMINKEDLLNWKSVRAGGIRLVHAAAAPLVLAVGDVVVDKAYSRIVVTPEGKLNVQQLRTATPAQPQGTAPAPPAQRDIRIDRITFVDSRLNFTDHYIKPNYTADVRELQGSVTGLSSEPASRAIVDLKGRWDAASPVVIAGTVNPLGGDLFADIGATGREIELTKLTAYSQRYAGYGITDGRLTLDVKYHIEKGKLEGRNKLVIDQLTFGEKVESPDATKLPVLFAVNLLKDANGRIDLELPISGSLEDPKFEVGALVGQVVGNLFKKVVTSPFSLIATGDAVQGDPGELAYLEFDPGVAEVTPAGSRKLETLVKLLQDRPGLKLEIASRIDVARDVEALRAVARERKLAEAPKVLSRKALEELAQEPIEISQDELRALAAKRAEQVRAFLVASGRLPAQRVVVADESAPAHDRHKAKMSRVDFALR